jgi:hypothetical protein
MTLGTREEEYKGYLITSYQRSNYYLYSIAKDNLEFFESYPGKDLLLITSHKECLLSAKQMIDIYPHLIKT